MAAHMRLKNEFTEDEKYHNLVRWLNCYIKSLLFLAEWRVELVYNYKECDENGEVPRDVVNNVTNNQVCTCWYSSNILSNKHISLS